MVDNCSRECFFPRVSTTHVGKEAVTDGEPHLRRARFSGNGDFEIDCELAWDQTGQAGFRFPNISADMQGRLRAWIAANGIAVSPSSATVPKPERTQLAASALAQLDELRSMLLNSKLTLEGLKK